ncbi:MAG: HDIG domain-containing protein [Paramuribaculum sp.]|nr:HDIG domain-containing protein [Paramuribaculum sp.]
MNYQNIIDKYYPVGTLRRDIYMRHCQCVANEALSIAHSRRLPLTDDEITSAAMLHDIGIFQTDALSIGCEGSEPYIRHGILGAELLRNNGADEKYARVAELHTGAGLTAEEIIQQKLPLPHKDFLPDTVLEKLICYADKFYSKGGNMERKSLEKITAGMEKFGSDTLNRFLKLHSMFG